MSMATANKTQNGNGITASRNAMPPVATVYRAADGALHHARCAQRMGFQGGRAGVELDFYCTTCCEHITLTPYVLMRLPNPADGAELTAAPAR
jgi:hypothetical protein